MISGIPDGRREVAVDEPSLDGFVTGSKPDWLQWSTVHLGSNRTPSSTIFWSRVGGKNWGSESKRGVYIMTIVEMQCLLNSA